jgi:hypothetical protein
MDCKYLVCPLNRLISARFGVLCFTHYNPKQPSQKDISYLFASFAYMLTEKATERKSQPQMKKKGTAFLAGFFPQYMHVK